ncbi:RNA polymerase II-associated protein spaghetti isoform X2 [Tachypleus tridentatus]|uniref:RNA polymerase II-associated protein spaghetti isoform X2 n=1 Tax=Tachypleus tridentatus TaxID=6853 RepID=UPI003FD187B3
MDSDKTIQLQHQIRENNEELQSFLRELNNWESEIKCKDEELKSQKRSERDLSKEKVLKEMDQESDVKSDSESGDEEEILQIQRQKQKAFLDKEKGNEYFKEGKYDEAIACYTVGIQSDPCNAVLLANRAMAFLKKRQLAAAEQDCDMAITLDPTYLKAFHRRGVARFGLKKYDLAKADFQTVLEVEPENQQTKAELGKLEKELKKKSLNKVPLDKSRHKEASDPQGIGNSAYNFQKEKSVELTSSSSVQNTSLKEETVELTSSSSVQNKSLKEESIELTSLSSVQNKSLKEETVELTSSSSMQNKSLKEESIELTSSSSVQNKSLDSRQQDTCSIVEPIFKPPHLRSKKPFRRLEIQEIESDWFDPISNKLQSSQQPLVCHEAYVETLSETLHAAEYTVSETSQQQNLTPKPSHEVITQDVKALPRVQMAVGCPHTAFQFQADWRKLRNSKEKLFEYLKQISPEKFPELFKHSLETEVFSDIISLLKSHFVKEHLDVLPYLKNLTKIGRFNTLVMFLSSEDLEVIQYLLKFVKASGNYNPTEIHNIANKYGLSSV